MLSKEAVGLREDRLLTMLERLLELPTNDMNSTLNQATQLVADVLAAEKVEAFLHDAATDALVVLDNSDTPVGMCPALASFRSGRDIDGPGIGALPGEPHC